MEMKCEPIYRHMALTLKGLRQERGWSLDKAAEATGVSKAMLGQIEREESSPTIATLWKIASGFQTSFSSFIEDVWVDLNEPMYRKGQVQNFHPTDEKIRVLLPQCEHLSPPHKHGVIEHVIVVDGQIEVLVNGAWQLLCGGEGLRFNANQPHGYRNTTSEMVRFHDIIHYPKS